MTKLLIESVKVEGKDDNENGIIVNVEGTKFELIKNLIKAMFAHDLVHECIERADTIFHQMEKDGVKVEGKKIVIKDEVHKTGEGVVHEKN